MIWLLVGIGGAIGSVARHALNHLIHQRTLTSPFPLATFVINVVGSMITGIIAGVLASERWHWPNDTKVLVIVGILGGFTTFSSFSLDTLALLREGHHEQALLNVAGQVLLSLAAVWAGYRLGSAV